MYEWIKGSVYHMVITLYPTNITLNSSVVSKLEGVRWVMLGLDRENYKLAIKPIPKRDIDLKLVEMDQLHKVSIGNGYGRISNKAIMGEVSRLLDRDITGVKIEVIYDESEDMLIADLRDIE